MDLFLSQRSKYFIIIMVIAIIVVIYEVLQMANISSIANSVDKLEKIDKKITFFNIASIVGIAITFIAGIFLIIYNIDATKIRDVKIALANENAAKSNERAAKAELQSKELQLKLETLKLAVADRFIPSYIYDDLLDKLNKYNNKKFIIYCVIANTDEPLLFAKVLYKLFESANWSGNIIENHNVIIPAPRGLIITAFGESNNNIAKYIYEQFSSLGYISFHKFHEQNQVDLRIDVFAK